MTNEQNTCVANSPQNEEEAFINNSFVIDMNNPYNQYNFGLAIYQSEYVQRDIKRAILYFELLKDSLLKYF